MNQDHRKQSIRTIIQIKRVWLAVRFNCKLSFIIRNQLSEKVAEIDNTYNLFRGECLVNETIYFELPQEVLANRCKKLKLIVMMISANGMVPAGFVNFSTHTRSPYEQFQAILPLERCEDTRAQIKFMHMYEFCSKTPIENSFINQRLNRQDIPLHQNETPFSKINKKSSHSASRENLSSRKYSYKDKQVVISNQRLNFSRPLVSPRTLTKNFEGINSQKSVKIHSFQRGYEDDKITEEKEPLDSSINPLSKQQLMKEHQEYWLEIIRLEEEVENLKEENGRVTQQNRSLKGQAETLKEYYEGHQEKIHAFLGEIQENSQTIKKLQEKLQHQSHAISMKDQLIRQLQENTHKHDDLEEIMKVFAHEKSIAAHEHEILTQKVLFLQGEVVKLTQKNLELKDNLSACSDKNYFLSNNNEAQRHIITELEKKFADQSKKANIYATFQQEKQSLIQELHILRQTSSKEHERLQETVKLLQSQVQEKESINLQKSQQEELEMIALSKHAQSMHELQTLKKAYDNIVDCSSIDQSKLRIFQRELQLSAKQKEDIQLQMRRSQEEVKLLREQNEELTFGQKMLQLKLIEQQANIAGKTCTIDELRAELQGQCKERLQLTEKLLNIERQFEELALQLSKEVEEKNRMTIILTTLEDNSKNVENQLKHYMKNHQDLVRKHSQLKKQLQSKEKSHQEERSQLQLQIELKQQQLTEMIEKASSLQMDLQSALNVIEEHKRSKNAVRDQYQDSYNQSMTALTLKNGKMQKQIQEANQQLQKSKLANKLLSQKLQLRENEIAEVKGFTRDKLQENLKLIKEREQLKKQLSNQQAKVIKAKELLQAANKENQVKIQQLKSQLQFVTEILQRERQEKSDIEKEIDHLEKSQLPQIYQVGQLKQESFDSKQEDVHLEIQSKVISSQETIKEEKAEGNNKKKKKKR